MWSLYKLSKEVLSDKKTTIEWCISKGLIKIPICDSCGGSMKLSPNEGFFKCKHNGIYNKISIRDNSWFETSKLKIEVILILTYLFSIGNCKYEIIKRETNFDGKIITDQSIAYWLSLCKDVCLKWLTRENQNLGKIGGKDHYVQIDESMFGKRKHNKGRIVYGQWVFGMIDLGTPDNPKREIRLEICRDNKRDTQTLPYIQKNVLPDSIIISDMWKSYNCLEKYGFKHLIVNHKKNFVDPITKAHTQHIEAQWRLLKRNFSSGGFKKENLSIDLSVIQWRNIIKSRQLDPFDEFINAINYFYSQ